MKNFTRSRLPRPVKTLIACAFWLLLWSLASLSIGQELILPSPYAVTKALVSLAREALFWRSAGLSLLRIFGGFAVGAALGALLALATEFSELLDAIFSPAIRVVRATPVASFIILALLWLGHSLVPFFISALMVLPVVWGQTAAALRSPPASCWSWQAATALGLGARSPSCTSPPPRRFSAPRA